jgi:hypothetical protein
MYSGRRWYGRNRIRTTSPFASSRSPRRHFLPHPGMLTRSLEIKVTSCCTKRLNFCAHAQSPHSVKLLYAGADCAQQRR